MNAASRPSSEGGQGDKDDPPAREVERDPPRRNNERVVEAGPEVPFIEREVPSNRR